jgi:hypothetical protein
MEFILAVTASSKQVSACRQKGAGGAAWYLSGATPDDPRRTCEASQPRPDYATTAGTAMNDRGAMQLHSA